MGLSKINYKKITEFNREDAIELQRLLNNCGYGLDVDGIIGPLTIKAFNDFKVKHSLSEPDIFGSTTYVYLRKYDNDLSPALDLIKKFEGLVLNAYVCPANVWTVGWGTTVYPNGVRVKKGDKVTKARADELLEWYVKDRIIYKLSNTIPFWQEMSNLQRCALISFAYNVGEGFYGLKGYATITKALRNKDWLSVPNAMMLYVNPGTSAEQGLRRRRNEECTMWRNGM
jgi:lysozyme